MLIQSSSKFLVMLRMFKINILRGFLQIKFYDTLFLQVPLNVSNSLNLFLQIKPKYSIQGYNL